jgi:hemoglobin
MQDQPNSLYELVGGDPVIRTVQKIFYDKLFVHPWLKDFFRDIKQEVLEGQQTDFMAHAMGGPDRYCGKFPVAAHVHMYITEEVFELRHSLLKDSLREARIPDALAARWLKIDYAFKGRLCKKGVGDCVGRYKNEPILIVPRPEI